MAEYGSSWAWSDFIRAEVQKLNAPRMSARSEKHGILSAFISRSSAARLALDELILPGHRQRRHGEAGFVIEILRHQILLRVHDHVPRDLQAAVGGFAAHDAGHGAVGDFHGFINVRAFAEDAR